MTKWISVKDRLPKSGSTVLVYCGDGGIHSARFCSDNDYGIVGGWECCGYCGGESRVTTEDFKYHELQFTHWALLTGSSKMTEEDDGSESRRYQCFDSIPNFFSFMDFVEHVKEGVILRYLSLKVG